MRRILLGCAMALTIVGCGGNDEPRSDASADGAADAASDAMIWTQCSTRIREGDRCMGDLGPCHGDCIDGGSVTYICEEGTVRVEGGC